jgi:hypothetical protein
MPTVLREYGYRFFFYANENGEPPHIHVQYEDATAKFWLRPVVLAKNLGMNVKELGNASKLVQKHEFFLKGKWDEFFNK